MGRNPGRRIGPCGGRHPRVHAAEDKHDPVGARRLRRPRLGAVANAVTVPQRQRQARGDGRPVPERLAASQKNLAREFGPAVDVPADRQFTGFDAYRKAIDCLRPGDVALLTTHSAFRPIHLEYAVEKGVNVFMEKSFAPDPAGIKRIIRAGEAAEKKNLKIAGGLMSRHSPAAGPDQESATASWARSC